MVSKTVVKNRRSKPVASKGKSKPDAKLAKLARRLSESVLPGDAPFQGEAVNEAAEFLLKVAAQRAKNRSAMSMASVSEKRRFLRIAIINDDMPFLVDSIAATIAEHGIAIDRLVHPVINVRRSNSGKLTRLGHSADEQRESMIYIETPRIDARERRELEGALRATLGDVRAAVNDWPALQARMIEDSGRTTSPENAQLLRWLNDGMLTQLGHLTRTRDGSHSDLLGICRKSARQILAEASYDRAFELFEKDDSRDLIVIKANRISNVHRLVPLDLFIIPIRNRARVTALSIHAGVWTSAALASPPHEVPRLRVALQSLTDSLGFRPGGHASKALVHALTTLPHDLLIGLDLDSIARVSTTMMSLVDRPRPRIVMIEGPLARHIFAFVWFPRDLMATQVRLQIANMLAENTGTEILDWSLEVEGGNLAMLRFVLDIREARSKFDEAALETRLEDMLRGWGEAVERHLAEQEDPSRAAAIAARYAGAFPPAYRTNYGPAEAAVDILRLRALSQDEAQHRDARLYHLESDPPENLRMKIYQQQGAMPLSDVVPALENFGFRVLTEMPTALEEGKLGTVHDFKLELSPGESAGPILERASAIEAAIASVFNGRAEDDPFNRLVLGVGLSAEQADWLRAFYRYLRQTGMGFTIYTVVDALRGAPSVTRALIDLFVARHDPDFSGNRDEAAANATAALKRGLSHVAAINDDRLLRLYRALIKAILRTNAFAPAGIEALAFKIDSALVPNLPKPVPWREIFVYSRRVEGIHLRSGPVARGGLRWSDRRDDFRTEILGLMKAQRVKNAVIVPTGAKGGFYPKQLPSPAMDREGAAAEGQAGYEIFIRTLLSVTDNIAGGQGVHP
ncbi:MAG TPA: glutamate dehydrogenase, partial [Erythrobacter sp.]|nr:glutamate dehydrogenase [Erythrobacter sp.]